MGAVAVAAGGRLPRNGMAPLAAPAARLGVAVLTAAPARTLPAELAVLTLAGVADTALPATSNTSLQLTADLRVRGRAMAV